MKKVLIVVAVLCGLAVLFALPGMLWKDVTPPDSIEYKGENYVFLDYPRDIFYYDYNGTESSNFEVEGTYPLTDSQWLMLWNEEDIYCMESDLEAASAYYGSDENYDWFIVVDDDEEITYPLELSADDIEGVYALEHAERDTSIFFEEIEKFGSLIKVSKDGFIKATIGLAQYEGDWYWRTETIDEENEKDGTWAEYVCNVPESVNEKMKQAIK